MSIEQVTAPAASEQAMAEWNAVAAQADEVIGYSLIGGKENEETLAKLKGVPFVIEGVTFRKGDIVVKATGQARDYLSVEALVHPRYQSRFKRSRVVFNDGSTGIYRQIVKYLTDKGLITVPENLPEEGEANATRYDVSFSRGDDGGTEFDIRLVCPEGLRDSAYTNENGSATTWYLA
jgi:hypothetical protein